MAGVDKLMPFIRLLPSAVSLTNAKGAFSASLAEYCITAILYFNKQIPRLMANQRQRVWDKFIMNTVSGKTVGFLGYGSIATATARLCKALGMRVIALKNTIADKDDMVDAVWTTNDPVGTRTFFQSSDFVVCSLPATPATQYYCTKSVFAMMKPTAVFLSVGRGEVVDESALVDALKGGTIAGAALDVFAVEPLPSTSSLWTLPNCLISSHNADWIESYFEDSVDIFQRNIHHWLAGEPFENVVNRIKGY